MFRFTYSYMHWYVECFNKKKIHEKKKQQPKIRIKKRAYEWSQISNHHSRLPELTNSALYIGDNRQD